MSAGGAGGGSTGGVPPRVAEVKLSRVVERVGGGNNVAHIIVLISRGEPCGVGVAPALHCGHIATRQIGRPIGRVVIDCVCSQDGLSVVVVLKLGLCRDVACTVINGSARDAVQNVEVLIRRIVGVQI